LLRVVAVPQIFWDCTKAILHRLAGNVAILGQF
jgi:hypothetical protein